METITLTPRFIVVLSRYFKAHRGRIIKNGLKNQGEELESFRYNEKIYVSFDSEVNRHNEDCGNYDEDDNIVYNKECQIVFYHQDQVI